MAKTDLSWLSLAHGWRTIGGQMKPIHVFALVIFTPSAAMADPGHIAGLAGHDHWIAGIALAGAAGAALWGIIKGGKGPEEAREEHEEDPENEAQEA